MSTVETKPVTTPREPLKVTLLGFADARSKLLDVAAFLDRCDRYGEAGDVRHEAIRQAIALLADGAPERTRRLLELLSDPSVEPIDQCPGKAAVGVWPGLPRKG